MKRPDKKPRSAAAKAGCAISIIVLSFLGLVVLTAFMQFESGYLLAAGGWKLLSGWVLHLTRVIPQMHIDWDLCAGALAAAAGGAFGFHVLARWLTAAVKPGAAWKWRWTLGFTALTGLAFGCAVAATGAVHQASWVAKGPLVIDENREHYSSASYDVYYWLRVAALNNNRRFPDNSVQSVADKANVTMKYFSGKSLDDKPPALLVRLLSGARITEIMTDGSKRDISPGDYAETEWQKENERLTLKPAEKPEL